MAPSLRQRPVTGAGLTARLPPSAVLERRTPSMPWTAPLLPVIGAATVGGLLIAGDGVKVGDGANVLLLVPTPLLLVPTPLSLMLRVRPCRTPCSATRLPPEVVMVPPSSAARIWSGVGLRMPCVASALAASCSAWLASNGVIGPPGAVKVTFCT